MKTTPMTEGPILRPVLTFTIPILLTSLLQTLYNAVDSVIVGRFAEDGEYALAAVGSTGSIHSLFVGLFVGISAGAGVVVAQYFGSNNTEGVSKSVHTAISLSLILGILTTVFGIILSPVIIKLTDTPPEIFDLAVIYMRIIFSGMLASTVYNFAAGILRSIGDSKRPLIYLIISSIINVVLNCIFVICFNMSVDGVAWSTVISQIVSAVLVVIRLLTTKECYKLRIKQLSLKKKYVIQILKIGIPAGLQSTMFNFANVIVQAQVNAFGPAVVAARAAVSKFEGLLYACANSFGLAVTTFSGQNKGARKYDRIIHGTTICMIVLTLALAVVSGIAIIFRDNIIGLFNDRPEVINAGSEIFIAMIAGYFLLGIMEILSGSIRGAGEPIFPMIASITGIFGGRLAWIFTMKLFFPESVVIVILSYPVSWFIISAAQLIYFKKFRKRWLYN